MENVWRNAWWKPSNIWMVVTMRKPVLWFPWRAQLEPAGGTRREEEHLEKHSNSKDRLVMELTCSGGDGFLYFGHSSSCAMIIHFKTMWSTGEIVHCFILFLNPSITEGSQPISWYTKNGGRLYRGSTWSSGWGCIPIAIGFCSAGQL